MRPEDGEDVQRLVIHITLILKHLRYDPVTKINTFANYEKLKEG